MNDAAWTVQTSFKTPGGALINVRAERFDELAIGLESLATLVPAILSVEQLLVAGGNVAAQMPLAQPAQQNSAQYQPQQQAPQQQFGQAPAPQFAQVPQASAMPPGQAPLCLHNQPAKWVPPGISKKTGSPYKGFFACNAGRDSDCGFTQR
jgi:hypothetical protein